ncbi:MAG: aminoacyl-tRNA hydrolase [Verrucomicrobiota bacterium]
MSGHLSLVVGLGNPGLSYRDTRHNLGFEVLDKLAAEERLTWKKARYTSAQVCQMANSIWLLKPMDYMNTSGPVVARAMQWFKIPAERVLVMVDDVNLPLGKLRLRTKGSAGGHNGLKSIEQALSTLEYPRLRGGVGPPGDSGKDLSTHVLGQFGADEKDIVEKMKEQCAEVIKHYHHAGPESAMLLGNTET